MPGFLRFALPVMLVAIPSLTASGQSSQSSLTSAEFGSGYAGVYPEILRGRITASGARYDPDRLVASHRTLPIGSLVRVVNERNGRDVEVRIIDRGPYSGDRIMDLSERAASEIGLGGGEEAFVRILKSGARERQERPVRITGYGAKTWAGSTGFTVQLGSFSTKAAAEAVKQKVDGSWIYEVTIDGQQFYRLNYGRYRSREEAESDIGKLEAEGFFGFVKSVSDSD